MKKQLVFTFALLFAFMVALMAITLTLLHPACQGLFCASWRYWWWGAALIFILTALLLLVAFIITLLYIYRSYM